MNRLKRAALLLVAVAVSGCANATSGSHDLSGEGGIGLDGGHDAGFSVPDLSVPDLSVPDLAVPVDLWMPDLQLACDSDANMRLCGGNKCLALSQCCTATECPTPANGSATCLNNTCGVACVAGYKACNAKCIPNANCCGDGDCTTPGDPCKLAAGATCGANGVCNYLPVTCAYAGQTCNAMGTCVCPAGQHTCQKSASCIPDNTCCTSTDCGAISGQVCPSPGSTCTCTAGFKACGASASCILQTTCCTTSDCAGVAGETCSGAGGSCSCPANQKVCGASCIPSANCCTNPDCSSVIAGEVCAAGSCACPTSKRLCSTYATCITSGTCCIDSDCPLSGAKCSGIGGSCSCPAGTKACAASGSCISTSSCCSSTECTVSGQTCVGGPPGNCQCPGGQKVCGSVSSCIANANCCTAADCGLTFEVSLASCSPFASSSCSVNLCQTGFYDLDGIWSNGCECGDDPNGKACNAATGFPSQVGFNQSFSVSGRLPAANESDWFQVTFLGAGDSRYHPTISITPTGGDSIVFDVVNNPCGSQLSCDEPRTSGGLTQWEVRSDSAGGAPSGNGGGGTSPWSPYPAVGNGGTVWVRVYRNAGSPTCNSFTLTATNNNPY